MRLDGYDTTHQYKATLQASERLTSEQAIEEVRELIFVIASPTKQSKNQYRIEIASTSSQ